MSEVTPKPVSRKGSISDLKRPTGSQNSVLEWAWGSSVRKDPAGPFNKSPLAGSGKCLRQSLKQRKTNFLWGR